MKYIPPYHFNFDGSHCWQSCMRSILEGFDFGKKWYKWDFIDEVTGKRPDLWSWPFETFANIDKLGCEAHIVSDYDFHAFAEDFEKANIEFYGTEAAEKNIMNSDAPAEMAAARKMVANIQSVTIEQRTPEISDIRKLLEEGYLIIAWVNPLRLRGKQGYAGHYVLVYDIDDTDMTFHDSGRRTEAPADKMSFERYLAASRENGRSEGMFAIRPKQNA